MVAVAVVAVAVVAVVALLSRGCSRVELCVAGIVRESAIWWSVAMARAIGGEARAALPRRFVLVEAGGCYSFCSFVRPRGEVRDTAIWWVYRAREGNSNDVGYAWFRGVVVKF